MNFFKSHIHESFDRKEKVVLGSDKKFGYTFGAVFFLLSVAPLLINLKVRLIFLVCSIGFTATAMLEPQKLHALNLLWAKLGFVLSKILSPVVLAVLFYLVILPTGLLLKILKKDILNIKINRLQKSYWTDSQNALASSMKDQF